MSQLEEFEVSRGFQPGELAEYGVTVNGPHVYFPTLGRGGPWTTQAGDVYARQRCSGGCHPKYKGPKGEPLHLYNPLGLGPHSDVVWIAEGELDTLSLLVAGIPAVGILGVGTFKNFWRHLFDGARIVVALDSDEAGRASAEKIAQQWPDGDVSIFDCSPHNDLNEFFQEDYDSFEEAVTGW